MIEKFIVRVISEEGFSSHSYQDDAKGGSEDPGRYSWGYGTKAPGPGAFITIEAAREDLRKAVEETFRSFNTIFMDCYIPEEKALALLDMIYNMGEKRFRKFKKLIRAVQVEDWEWAAEEIRKSVYYKQVHARAEENALAMEGKA